MEAERVGFLMVCFIFHKTPNCSRYLQKTVLSQNSGIEVVDV